MNEFWYMLGTIWVFMTGVTFGPVAVVLTLSYWRHLSVWQLAVAFVVCLYSVYASSLFIFELVRCEIAEWRNRRFQYLISGPRGKEITTLVLLVAGEAFCWFLQYMGLLWWFAVASLVTVVAINFHSRRAAHVR